MAINTKLRKLSEAELNNPDLGDDGELDVESYPILSSDEIEDPYLAEVLDAARELLERGVDELPDEGRRNLLRSVVKAPCEQGQTAAQTDCTPESSSGGSSSLSTMTRRGISDKINSTYLEMFRYPEGSKEREELRASIKLLEAELARRPKPESKPESKPASKREDGDAQVEWEASLSKGQKDAVASWTKGNQDGIRRAIIGEKVEPWAKKRAKELLSAMSSAPKYEGTTYRGLKSIDFSKLQAFTEVGAEVTLRGPASTSKDAETASSFLQAKAVFIGQKEAHNMLLEIQGRTGVDIANLADPEYTHQGEVITKPGARYKVVRYEKREQPIYTFDFNRKANRGESAAEYIARTGVKPEAVVPVHYVVLEEI